MIFATAQTLAVSLTLVPDYSHVLWPPPTSSAPPWKALVEPITAILDARIPDVGPQLSHDVILAVAEQGGEDRRRARERLFGAQRRKLSRDTKKRLLAAKT